MTSNNACTCFHCKSPLFVPRSRLRPGTRVYAAETGLSKCRAIETCHGTCARRANMLENCWFSVCRRRARESQVPCTDCARGALVAGSTALVRPHSDKRTPDVRSRSRLRPVVLTGDEQTRLERWVERRRTARALALRARIVLSCSRGRSNREVARRLAVTVQTVGKWRSRFLELRADGLLDQPRSGAPRSISDELVEAVLAKTLHERAPDGRRWSSRRLADELGISQGAVLRIWRAFEV